MSQLHFLKELKRSINNLFQTEAEKVTGKSRLTTVMGKAGMSSEIPIYPVFRFCKKTYLSFVCS